MVDDCPILPSSDRDPTLEATMDAISILLDAERVPRVTGRAALRSWPWNWSDDMLPPGVASHHFDVDHRDRTWSLSDDSRRFVDALFADGRRLLIGDHAEPVSVDAEWPDVIRLLFPTSVLDMWGRGSDTWRIVGAYEVDSEYVVSAVHFLSDASRFEIVVDKELRLPTAWTMKTVLGPTRQITLSDVEVHGSLPERIVQTGPDVGVSMIGSSVVDDSPRWWED